MKMYSSLVAIVWAVLIHHISCQTATRSLKIASTAKITQVYVDGVAVTGVNFGTSWSRSTMFAVAGSSRVLAVKFDSSTKPDAFIIADGTTSCGFYTSPATVKCVASSFVSRVTNSWYLPTFIDATWPSASVSSVASKVLIYPTRQFCQQANWMWTSTPASVIYCRIRITPSVICPTLSLPNSVLNTTVTSFTTAVRVRCIEGYTIDRRNPLINSIDTVCTRTGTWSPFPISCQLIRCPTLNVTNSVLNTSDTSFATAVRVRCNETYAIDPTNPSNNSIDTVCTRGGNWSPFPILCQLILCPPLNVSNAQLNTTDAHFATTVRVRCNEGFSIDPYDMLNNSIDTVCTSSGTWSPFPISCQRLRLAIIEGDSNVVKDIAQLNDQFFVLRYDTPKVFVYNATSFQLLREITLPDYRPTRFEYLSASAINNYLYVYGYTYESAMLYQVNLSDMDPETNVMTLLNPEYIASGLIVTNAGNIIMCADNLEDWVEISEAEAYMYEYTPNGTLVRTLTFSNVVVMVPVHDFGNGVLLSIIYPDGPVMISLVNTTDGTIIKSSGLVESFDDPGLAVDSRGYILVADYDQNKIIVVNPSLTAIRELPLPGITYQTYPDVLCLDSSRNRLYIGEGSDDEWSGSYRLLVVLDGVTNLGALFN